MSKRKRRFGVFDTMQQVRDLASLPDCLRDDLHDAWRSGVKTQGQAGYPRKFRPEHVTETKRIVAGLGKSPAAPLPYDEMPAELYEEIREQRRYWDSIRNRREGLLPRDLSDKIRELSEPFESFAKGEMEIYREGPPMSASQARIFGRRCVAAIIDEIYGLKP